jgi:hypothetical protein
MNKISVSEWLDEEKNVKIRKERTKWNVYKILCKAVTSFNDVIKNDTSHCVCVCMFWDKEGKAKGNCSLFNIYYTKSPTTKATEVNDQVDLQFILISFDQANKN